MILLNERAVSDDNAESSPVSEGSSGASPPGFPWEKYRLRVQSPDLRAEGLAPNSVPYLASEISVGAARTSASDAASPPKRAFDKTRRISGALNLLTRGEIVLVSLSVMGLVAAALVLLDARDAQEIGAFALIALAPLTVVVALLVWADRYAPIRARYLLLSGLWGAGIATLIAGLVNSGLFQDFVATIGDV